MHLFLIVFFGWQIGLSLVLPIMLIVAFLVAVACPGMALTTEPNLRQSTSLAADLAFEDLMNVLDRVDPAETPLYSMCRREYELGNTEFSWEVDSWPSANGALGPGDGYAVQTATETRDVTANRRKMGNIGQAFRRVFGAGWIANQVPKLPGSGKGKLLADGATDAMVLLKQDIEAAFSSADQTATPDVGGATGSLLAGVFKLIDKTNAYTAPSTFNYGKPTDLHFAPTGATITGTLASTFNLASIRTVAKVLRQTINRNKDYVFLTGLDLRSSVTALVDPIQVSATGGALAPSQQRIFTQAQSDSELGISIDVIRTDWGRWMVIPTDFIGKTTLNSTGGSTTDATRSTRVFTSQPGYGLILSREKLFKRWGVPFQPDTLQNDGGGTNRQVRCYVTVGVGNPQGFGYYQLT